MRERSAELVEELASRGGAGLTVSLCWRRSDDNLTVVVTDARLGASFEVEVGGHNPLDVFHHPFAYAAA